MLLRMYIQVTARQSSYMLRRVTSPGRLSSIQSVDSYNTVNVTLSENPQDQASIAAKHLVPATAIFCQKFHQGLLASLQW
jgi:hypothetical protein